MTTEPNPEATPAAGRAQPSTTTIDFAGRLVVRAEDASRVEHHLRALVYQIGATLVGMQRSDSTVPLLPGAEYMTAQERMLHGWLDTPLSEALSGFPVPQARIEALADDGARNLRDALVLGKRYVAGVRSIGATTLDPLGQVIAEARGMESDPAAAWPDNPGFADRARWCTEFEQISGGVIGRPLGRYNLHQLLIMPPKERLVVLSALGAKPAARQHPIPPSPQRADDAYAAIRGFADAFAEARWAWTQTAEYERQR